jgi:hypothetical protein
LEFVERRIKKYRKFFDVHLIKGFYSESLAKGPQAYNIKKAGVIFVDCDTYFAAKDVFKFCESIIQQGTVIVLDDRLMYKGDPEAGESYAFQEFIRNTGIKVRKFGYYGFAAAVYVVVKFIGN